MRLLIVSETLNTGGAEKFILRLASYLKRSGQDITVLNMNAAHENHQMTSQFPDLPIIRMKMPFLRVMEKLDEWLMRAGIDFSVKYFFQKRLLRKKYLPGYDIIHSNYSRIDYLIAKLNEKGQFKHVVSVHGDYSDQYYRDKKGERTGWLNIRKKIETIVARVSDLVVVSEEQRNFFQKEFKVPVEKIHKVYYGLEPLVTRSIEIDIPKNKKFRIGMVARGTAQKGWQLLIDAFKRLPPGAELVLVGEGKYLEQLRKKYGADDSIIFTGFHASPIDLIAGFDVFVLPSQYPFESLPNSIIEALYCGKPIVASEVGEIKAMITDEETGEKAGFLLDMSDPSKASDQLLEHLQYLMAHPEQIVEISKRARSCFQKFTMEKCAAAYMTVYREALSK